MSEILPDLGVRKSEYIAFAISQAMEVAQVFIRPPNFDIPRNPLNDFLVYNTGDIGNGYWLTFFTDNFIRLSMPRFPTFGRRVISASVASAAIVVVETQPQLHFGTADVNDIPAGLFGIAACLGVSIWAMRKKST